MHDVGFHLYPHSKKLILALGLINTAPGTSPQKIKDLQVCEDCQTSIKFISKIVEEEIMPRDANCFHHFEDAVCSCMDYWQC
jgi:hypothetical protein